MKAKYIPIKKAEDENKLKEIANCIKKGGLVVFPTETVYGLGANALDQDAVSKLFKAKGRAGDNPLIVHIANLEMLSPIVENVGDIEKRLMEKFWPGPLTIILKKAEIIPENVSAGLDTIGVRMPSNKIALKLIKLSNVPIAAPSANISGKPSGTVVQDILEELQEKVDYIIDGGKTSIGVESTVVRVEENRVNILRPGKITVEDIENIGLRVQIDSHVLEKYNGKEAVRSPGVKYRHYAPDSKCIMVYSKEEKNMIKKINQIIAEMEDNVLVLARTRHIKNYNTENKLDMGDSLEEIGNNIFTLLRKVDIYNKELVIIEGVEKEGLGLAINNRLIRACEYHCIEC